MASLTSHLSKLLFLLLLSSAWMAPLRAHEVQPAIADLTAEDGVVKLHLQVNLEALLAGINLDGLANTDDAENGAAYDALRAQPAVQIAGQAGRLLADWNARPLVSAGGTAVLMGLERSMTADAIASQPRLSLVVLRGTLPPGEDSVTVAWPQGAGPLVLRQQGVDAPYTGYLEGGATSDPIDLKGGGAPTGWQVFAEYIIVGFDHILPKGLDHILFVLGLCLLSPRLGPLLWQISAFTAAHTVTLALGGLGLVTLPGSIVEPLIAASIVYVAVENIFGGQGLGRWRAALVFAFGLLHGLGFAGVLGEFGLPEAQFVPALLGFNLGVEFGQITVVLGAALFFWLALQVTRSVTLEGEAETLEDQDVLFRATSILGSLAIGFVGLFWVIERTLLG